MLNHRHHFKRSSRVRYLLALSCALFGVGLLAIPIGAFALSGRIVIAGYGPEQPVIQDLAHAYEKRHPGTAIDVEWDKTVRAIEMVKAGQAQIAVTDRADPSLVAIPVAWDGIAVIVNFSNPLTELTSDQVRGLFSGRVTRWSDLEGADKRVDVVTRSGNDNLTAGFETSLGIPGGLVGSGQPARSDQQTLRLVSGRDAAVSYISLKSAIRAQEDGIPIRVLTIDHVEPGEPTVANGRYPLRRPVLLLTAGKPDPLTASFVSFVRSMEGQPLLRTLYSPLGSSSAPTSPAQTQLSEKTGPAS
jgi:phosphate transport system substrate-binding protein